ncbi:MAG: 30S ribosomal protein S9 [Elusimicrobia bacterium]|nr:30S ribosomal protein S9 [Elusimicrobiota bacterium]
MDEIQAVGRRKCSIARVHLFPGKEKSILINSMAVQEYFSDAKDRIQEILSPFKALNIDNEYLIKINVCGGGKSGQVGAIRLGISRALAKLDEKSRKVLRTKGFLTRDARIVERKKPGRHKARKGDQFSKR